MAANLASSNMKGVELEEPPQLRMKDGSTFPLNSVLLLGGSFPNTEFMKYHFASSYVDSSDNRIRVNDHLQVIAPPHFGGSEAGYSSEASTNSANSGFSAGGHSPKTYPAVGDGRIFAAGAASNVNVTASGILDWRGAAVQASVICYNIMRLAKGSSHKLRSYSLSFSHALTLG